MSKGYTDFFAPLLGTDVATKPRGKMKYMDWDKAKLIVEQNPKAIIYAGLREDWNNTSGLIYAKGKYYDGYVYGQSSWATPIVDVDGEEYESYKYEPNKFSNKPDWWGNGEKLLNPWDYED